MFLNKCAWYIYCYLVERYIWWDPEMSHADILVCDQKQEAGPSFQNMKVSNCVDMLTSYRLVDQQSSIS